MAVYLTEGGVRGRLVKPCGVRSRLYRSRFLQLSAQFTVDQSLRKWYGNFEQPPARQGGASGLGSRLVIRAPALLRSCPIRCQFVISNLVSHVRVLPKGQREMESALAVILGWKWFRHLSLLSVIFFEALAQISTNKAIYCFFSLQGRRALSAFPRVNVSIF